MKKDIITITLHDSGEKIAAAKGSLLSSVLNEHGTHLDMPCAGKGTCKGCSVWADDEKVLACQTIVERDINVKLNHPFDFQQITAGEFDDIAPPNPAFSRYGISIDIGTTTISAILLDIDGKHHSVTRKNPQTIFGADVINRIEKALSGQLKELSESIRSALSEMIQELCDKAGIFAHSIDSLVITGNTVMLYLLAGHNPAALSHAPFIADRLFGQWVSAKELELPVSADAKVYLPRCMSAFVGGDITTAIIASGICDSNQTAILIDIGTNGEIVLWHKGALTCCSTAAGPAFEGAGITHGVYGIRGAIDHVWAEDNQVLCSTIDDAPPVGICGSGIVDGLAVMLNIGIVDETGAFANAGDFFELKNGIGISGKDVRKIQLAKGSIRAGTETLLSVSHLDPSDIEVLYIAGGFGRFLNLENAAKVGIIPNKLLRQSKVIGNAAHTGASLLLRDKELIQKSENIAKQSHTIELSSNPIFSENFMQYMMFE